MLDFRSQFTDVVRTTLPISTMMLLLDLLILNPTEKEFLLTLACYALIIVGFALFLYGVDIGVLPMGSAIGSEIPRRNSAFIAIGIVFLIGMVVTMAEPDVSVFSNVVSQLYPQINKFLITFVIALGVGIFVVVATLRIILNISIRAVLTVGYAIIIVLALFAPEQYLGIVFDTGGVTTGPMTIPILMSVGLGICSTISSKSGIEGFGMIGLASIGPLISVMVYGILLGEPNQEIIEIAGDSVMSIDALIGNLTTCTAEVLMAVIPLYFIFIVMQKFFLHYTWRDFRIMSIGIFFAGVGMVVFLVGIYSAFIPLSNIIGEHLIEGDYGIAILILGMTAGFLVVIAEPSIKILGSQVERTSNGILTRKIITLVVALGVSVLVGSGLYALSQGIMSIYYLLPLYGLAIVMMWLMDKDMIGITYDAGGVATGPMSVAILMTMYTAMARALPGSENTGAFGAISLIALAPILSLSILGIYIGIKKRKRESAEGI